MSSNITEAERSTTPESRGVATDASRRSAGLDERYSQWLGRLRHLAASSKGTAKKAYEKFLDMEEAAPGSMYNDRRSSILDAGITPTQAAEIARGVGQHARVVRLAGAAVRTIAVAPFAPGQVFPIFSRVGQLASGASIRQRAIAELADATANAVLSIAGEAAKETLKDVSDPENKGGREELSTRLARVFASEAIQLLMEVPTQRWVESAEGVGRAVFRGAKSAMKAFAGMVADKPAGTDEERRAKAKELEERFVEIATSALIDALDI